ncbi:sigma-70 family RNA polymerase sigma factor [Sediminicoccus sp. KRV36]|uniref:sigma-70 family RNA polymerase sigma factor n=1 Tax=Sediminicoccus sp. KRV36 TaxID=3133721 RepID=UPI00200EA948|nr:sigma-70 family RNA polymerase sigma factor [Sediminicoccus rosea]UPY38794.1 sigma-70 family RNA polymerase sigma factor [Sediminicoccus rosea]
MNPIPNHSATVTAPLEGVAPADFHDLMIAVLPSLRQQALALTRNRPDADDLVQSAVANALAARASFEPGTNFRAWMGSILRNRFLSDRRRVRPSTTIEEAPQSVLARSGGQEESLAMKELNHHLARLPAEQRLLLMRVSVEGASYEDLSVELGIPVGTLKARVSRTRAQLRAWLLGEVPSRLQDGTQRRVTTRQGAAPTRMPRLRGDAPGMLVA